MKTLIASILIVVILFGLPISLGLIFKANPPGPGQNYEPVKIKYQCSDTGSITEADLEEYLVGVLAAEMPANYPIEALKAQAVAARSFILSRIDAENTKHPGATVCTDSACCKGYLSKEDVQNRWDKKDVQKNWNTLKTAVHETRGQYLAYQGQVIEAFFFAQSGGKTENSEDVWQESRPYLKSVDSSWEIGYPETETVAEFTFADARNRLCKLDNRITPGNDSLAANVTSRTNGGSCRILDICGVEFDGQDIRFAFGLKSANFDVEVCADSLKFTVKGYGHGVGMSQFGAKIMALEGKNYEEILTHYYQNTALVTP